MNFNITTIDFGNLNEKKSYSAAFSYVGEPEELKLSSSCGCTDIIWDKENHAIKFTLNTGTVPKHLEQTGSYVLNKAISVRAVEAGKNEFFTLLIKGVVYK